MITARKEVLSTTSIEQRLSSRGLPGIYLIVRAVLNSVTLVFCSFNTFSISMVDPAARDVGLLCRRCGREKETPAHVLDLEAETLFLGNMFINRRSVSDWNDGRLFLTYFGEMNPDLDLDFLYQISNNERSDR
ncbi:hypothetical protein O3M35_012089 [Rhynocoris fuscipes]|uniref:Uncharacterized protein n=1 Tax=Rhynocoris fuscipes TaxID=488301 RepID=A0AAW1CUC0_9HEMI